MNHHAWLLSALGLLALTTIGCGPPRVPLPADYYQQGDAKVAVVVLEPGPGGQYKQGQQGLLDMAISEAVTAPLLRRLGELVGSNVLRYAGISIFESGLDARGKDSSVASEVVRGDMLPVFDGGNDVTYGKLDVRGIASAAGADQILLLDALQWGTTRKYYGFVALGPPSGYAKVQGILLDGDDNAVLWRQTVTAKRPVDGAWNEPDEYPGVARAAAGALFDGCGLLADDLGLPPGTAEQETLVELLTTPPDEVAALLPDSSESVASTTAVSPTPTAPPPAAAFRPPSGPPVQLTVGPVFHPHANNNFNKEFSIGATLGVRFRQRFAVEAQFLAFPMGTEGMPGEHNQTTMATAVANLLEPYPVEMFDPTASLVGRVRATPFLGTMPGTPVGLGFDLFFGGGFLSAIVEQGAVDWNTVETRVTAKYSSGLLPTINYGGSFKVLPHPSIALRLDIQALTSFDQLLDYADPRNAQDNRQLTAEHGGAIRLDCDTGAGAACKVGTETILMFGLGVDFYLPAGGGAR